MNLVIFNDNSTAVDWHPPAMMNADEVEMEDVGGLGLVARVALGLVLSVFIVVTITGNAMVLHAVRTDRKLQTVCNMFIVSLAIADLIVGLIVMPVSAVYVFTDDWVFGVALCQFWIGVDYTASTASILNLLVLSLDRYWSVTNPLKYLRKRTRGRGFVMISLAWVVSSLWIVPIVGWHHFVNGGVRVVPANSCDTEYATNTSLKITTSILNFYLPLAVMYVLYTKIFLEIRHRSKMELGQVFLYTGRGSSVDSLSRNSDPCLGGGRQPPKESTGTDVMVLKNACARADDDDVSDGCDDVTLEIRFDCKKKRKKNKTRMSAPDDNRGRGGSASRPVEAGRGRSVGSCRGQRQTERSERNSQNASRNGTGSSCCFRCGCSRERKSAPFCARNNDAEDRISSGNRRDVLTGSGEKADVIYHSLPVLYRNEHPVDPTRSRRRKGCPYPGRGGGGGEVRSTVDDPDSSDDSESGREIRLPQERHPSKNHLVRTSTGSRNVRDLRLNAPRRSPRPLRNPDDNAKFRRKSRDRKRHLTSGICRDEASTSSSNSHRNSATQRPTQSPPAAVPGTGRVPGTTSCALQKEIKAARQLGVIMGAFTVCFLPYFVCFTVVAFCDWCVGGQLMTTVTWVGYLNSTLNPFLYPLCNVNFRRKFYRMLGVVAIRNRLRKLGASDGYQGTLATNCRIRRHGNHTQECSGDVR